MNIRTFVASRWLPALAAALVAAGGSIAMIDRSIGAEKEKQTPAQSQPAAESYQPKTKVQLRRELSRIQYNVTQNEATEPAFRNRYWDNKRQGTYHCVVCDLPLFTSETKFKSGTGWPSFYAPLKPEHIGTRKDWHLFYARTEVHCRRCKAHLGHVFDDGPRPTGKRYCMNSAALKFAEKTSTDDKRSAAESRR